MKKQWSITPWKHTMRGGNIYVFPTQDMLFVPLIYIPRFMVFGLLGPVPLFLTCLCLDALTIIIICSSFVSRFKIVRELSAGFAVGLQWQLQAPADPF